MSKPTDTLRKRNENGKKGTRDAHPDVKDGQGQNPRDGDPQMEQRREQGEARLPARAPRDHCAQTLAEKRSPRAICQAGKRLIPHFPAGKGRLTSPGGWEGHVGRFTHVT